MWTDQVNKTRKHKNIKGAIVNNSDFICPVKICFKSNQNVNSQVYISQRHHIKLGNDN